MKPRRRTILKVLLLLIAGATLNVAVAWAWILVGPTNAFGVTFIESDSPPRGITEFRVGTPLRSMYGEFSAYDHSVRGCIDVVEMKITERWHDKTPRSSCLPYYVIWPGFAINTVFYAGVLWMLFCGPFALRRVIRSRRGQCPVCAYPLGQSPVCTECGAAVTPACKRARNSSVTGDI